MAGRLSIREVRVRTAHHDQVTGPPKSEAGRRTLSMPEPLTELDDRLETASMCQFVDTPMWNRPSAILSWQHYLGGQVGDEQTEIHAPDIQAEIDRVEQ